MKETSWMVNLGGTGAVKKSESLAWTFLPFPEVLLFSSIHVHSANMIEHPPNTRNHQALGVQTWTSVIVSVWTTQVRKLTFLFLSWAHEGGTERLGYQSPGEIILQASPFLLLKFPRSYVSLSILYHSPSTLNWSLEADCAVEWSLLCLVIPWPWEVLEPLHQFSYL